MRLAAVELYKPHYMGKPKDLEFGVNGVVVYPVAIGNYRIVHQPCGATAQASAAASKRIVVAISKFDADNVNRRHWQREFTNKADVKQTHEHRAYEYLWNTYGDTRNGPDWEWTMMLCTPQSLLPADDYESSKFVLDEWKAQMEVAEKNSADAAMAARRAMDHLKAIVGETFSKAKLSFVWGVANPEQCGHGMTVTGYGPNVHDGKIGGTVSFNVQALLAFLVRRRKLTKATAAALPCRGHLQMDVADAILFVTGKKTLPAKITDAVNDYVDAVTHSKDMQVEYQRLGSCRPGHVGW